MDEVTVAEKKLEALERIVKAITYTEKITYHGYNQDPSYVEFHGADPDNFKLRGYAEGLDLDWCAELYDREAIEIFGEEGTEKDARMVAEVWLFEDPYKRIESLETKVQSLTSSMIEEDK